MKVHAWRESLLLVCIDGYLAVALGQIQVSNGFTPFSYPTDKEHEYDSIYKR